MGNNEWFSNRYATRAWLDKEGFSGVLIGWKADAILGLLEANVRELIPGPEGLRLWGFLNTARQGKFFL